MKVKDMLRTIKGKVVSTTGDLERKIQSVYVGDLLSIVMASAKEDSAWLTIQSHMNIVAVASLVNVSCIIVTQGYSVDQEAIEKAKEEGVTIIETPLDSFAVAKELVQLGL